MSQETLDLRRSIRIVRRHKLLVGVAVTVGCLAGAGYAVLQPSMVTSTALVLLSPSGQAAQSAAAVAGNGGPDPYTQTQEVIAKSSPVLLGALPHIHPAMSINELNELRNDITIGSQTPFIISVSVQAKDAADAAANADAIARSYVAYIGASNNPGGAVQAQLLQSAPRGTGSGLIKKAVTYTIFALLGALFGAIIGIIIALAVDRSDRRLRSRDEIANSIGVPVLASFPVGHPSDPGGWTRLLENYKPGAMHALQLRKALQQLEMAAEVNFGRSNGRRSFTVLSLSTDPGALALGPQLATFAAAQGIRTTLIVAQQDAAVTASLRTACAGPPASPKWPENLRVLVSDGDVETAVNADPEGDVGVQWDATLAVIVGVVDGRNPQIPDTMRTTTTLLGVSAGAATADQLARVAVSADSGGREITGILVSDPDSADATTGRLPHLGRRPGRRPPTRVTGIATEIRR
jgi:capsular polysaccharide biosynthesis protein